MFTVNRKSRRLQIALTLTLLVPVGLAAQQHHHGLHDSTSARRGHAGEMMEMQDTTRGDNWMGMMSMMPGGNAMMEMPMSSLMHTVMRLQPSFVLKHSDDLNLTDEQVRQVEELAAAQKVARQEQMRSMHDDAQSFEDVFDSDDVDVEELRLLAESAMRPYRVMQWRAIIDARAVRALLSPVQREKTRSLSMGSRMMSPRQGVDSVPQHEH